MKFILAFIGMASLAAGIVGVLSGKNDFLENISSNLMPLILAAIFLRAALFMKSDGKKNCNSSNVSQRI